MKPIHYILLFGLLFTLRPYQATAQTGIKGKIETFVEEHNSKNDGTKDAAKDSLKISADSLKILQDSLALAADSLKLLQDSTAFALDTTVVLPEN